MDDFFLTMNCGYSSQDVIVGGESCIMDEIFCPDLKSFIQEEINLDDSEESSASVVSSDEGSMPSPGGITADNEEMIKVSGLEFFLVCIFCNIQKKICCEIDYI